MNSERRHELQKNELADALGGFLKKLEPYAPAILTGVVVVVIAALTVGYLRSRSADQRSDATLTYLLYAGQSNLDALAGVEKNFPGTQPAALAVLAKADIELAEGIDGMFTLREKSIGQLEAAVVDYKQVLAEVKDPLVQSRASLGLARAHEALGNVDEAIAAYEQVIAHEESDAMVQAAEQQIASLKSSDTQQFLAWFAEQKPELMDPAASPEMPSTNMLPDVPDMTLPQTPAAPEPPATPETPETPDATAEPASPDAATEPAEGEMKLPPAEEAPSETPAAEETPAEETTPAAEDAPAEEKAPAAEEAPAAEAEETPATEQPAVVEEVPETEDGPTELAPATGE